MTNQTLKKDIVQKDSYELYSFDIFDTLITRTTANPVGIFTIVQKKLQEDLKYSEIPEIVRNNFFTIRRESETFVRENQRCLYRNQDITFEQIYNNIKQNYFLNNEQIEILKQLEIETELKNLVPIPQNINKIKELILNGKKVILISDMYHEEETIKKFLSHVDPMFNNIKLYVSSEFNKTKASTALYRHIQTIEKVPFEKWCHCGDNMHADVNQAKALKMWAVHFPFPALKSYENSHLFKAYLCEEDFYSQMLIGCARLTRVLSFDKSPIYQFGCSFAGPILYNYVSWIIEQTQKRGLKNLYFVARDGYVLKLIADEIIKVKNLTINTKYIYGSRAAWRIPTEKTLMQFLYGNFDEYRRIFSLKFLSSRLFMDVNELKVFAGIEDISAILDNNSINQLYHRLINNSDFINRILEINKAKQDLLLEYLEQEIDFSEDTIAFVDLFGTGRTQDLLAEIINSKYDKNILSLYFHSAIEVETKIKSQKINYFSTIQFKHFSIELLCRNIDGQTLGYKKENGKIIPVFDEINSQKLLDWGYKSYIQGLKDYAKNASMIELINNYSINSFNVQKRYIKYYLNELDKDTADIFGSIPYLAVGSEKYIAECAREFNQQDYKNMLLNGNRDFCNVFDFISFKRSDVKFRKLFEFNKKHFSMKRLILSPLNKIFSLRNNEQKTHKILIVFGLEFKFLRQRKVKYNFIENIFSIKNDERGTHKILCFLGLKLKFKKK